MRRALISVSDKTGIVNFARELQRFDIEMISTGGTATVLRDAGIEVREVSDVTGFPEMMDGRIKTLHPHIHAGLLARRDSLKHLAALDEHGIAPIDLVVVNLYPFEQTIGKGRVTREEATEQIDIGGPAMIRSAAKNWYSVAVIVSPENYQAIADEMRRQDGSLSLPTRMKLARQAFSRTASYDMIISSYLTNCLLDIGDSSQQSAGHGIGVGVGGGSRLTMERFGTNFSEHHEDLPERGFLVSQKLRDLRYGENPHQKAALYEVGGGGVSHANLLSGKEMSFNNYIDADAAWKLVWDFDETACAIIKHTNPAGVALGKTTEEAYRKALVTDPTSAFGGIVAFNRPVSEAAARAVSEIFTEVIIAPEYEAGAVEVLSARKNLRVLRVGGAQDVGGLEYRQISGGLLVQTRDTRKLKREELKVVTERQPTAEELRALLFAWTVCKHTKSNAIVYARPDQTVGVGAGQMSRVDSVKIGAMRAQLSLEGSVMASDAFFPFRDGIDEAAAYGITAVVQPGGSIRDAEVIQACEENDVSMVFTGVRHFKH